eukprot:6751231-Lingulodinium_polyedra.AAC.1
MHVEAGADAPPPRAPVEEGDDACFSGISSIFLFWHWRVLRRVGSLWRDSNASIRARQSFDG